MAEGSVRERVIKVVRDQLDVKADVPITDESSFLDDLDADSLDTVELIMALEEEFGIVIPDEEAEKIGTVGAVIKYIEDHPK